MRVSRRKLAGLRPRRHLQAFYSPQAEAANFTTQVTLGAPNDGNTFSIYAVDGAGTLLYEDAENDQFVIDPPLARFGYVTAPTQNPIVGFVLGDADPYVPTDYPGAYGIGRCEGLPFATSLWRTDFSTDPVTELPSFFVALNDYAPFDVSVLEVSGTAQPGSLTAVSESNIGVNEDQSSWTFNYSASVYPDQSDPITAMRQFASYVQRVTVGSAVGDGTIVVSLPAGVLSGLSETTNLASNELTIVLDRGAPVIETAADVTVNVDWDASSGVAAFTPPTADDHGTTIMSVCDPASGSTFPVGDTLVTCTATDDASNMDSTSFTVSIVQDPPPVLDSIVISGAATATEGDTLAFTVAGLDQYGDPFPVPAGVTFTSSFAGDAVADDEVTLGFDPAAIGGSSTRTITARVGSAPVMSDSLAVEVASRAASIGIAAADGATSVPQGDSLDFAVTAYDADDVPLGDASSVVELSSSVPTDAVSGSTVTFPHASPHTITATVIEAPAFSASVTVQVIPPTTALGATGADFPTAILWTAALILGLGLVVMIVLATRRMRLQ